MTTKKERAEALARMTKAELIKTVKTLDARQVKLLNQIAKLNAAHSVNPEYVPDGAVTRRWVPEHAVAEARKDAGSRYAVVGTHWSDAGVVHVTQEQQRMPWETALAETTEYATSSGAPIKRGE